MDFRSYILLSESAYPSRDARQSNQFQDIQDRVKFGRGMEAKILAAIAENTGWVIDPASTKEDMHEKIDGWINVQGKKVPLQVKYRDSGDDILLEVYNSDRRNGEGRDMVSKALLYASLNLAGTIIRLRDASQLKLVAQNMYNQLLESGKQSLDNRFGQIRWTNDPRSGKKKVNAFLKAEAFQGKNITLQKSLWVA